MIALIPIFLQNDKKLWHSLECTKILKDFLYAVIHTSEKQRYFVFCNDDYILNLSETVGLESYMIENENHSKSAQYKIMPPGTHASVCYLNHVLNIKTDTLIILNFRTPLITSEIINQATHYFRVCCASILISVHKAIDHPCQLKTYYRIIDANMIYLLEEDKDMITPYLTMLSGSDSFDNNEFRLTRPFHFDWESKNIRESNVSEIFVRVCQNLQVAYVPVISADKAALHEKFSIFWIYCDQNTAKILFKPDLSDIFPDEDRESFHLAGGSFSSGSFYPQLFKDNNTGLYFLRPLTLSDVDTSYYEIRYTLLETSLSYEMSIINNQISDFSKPIPIKVEGQNVIKIKYSLLKMAYNSTFDICEPFPAIDNLWRIDQSSSRCFNINQGNEIMGRQNFPDLFCPDGAMFIMNSKHFESFESELIKGTVQGFRINESNSIEINTDFDLVKCRTATMALHRSND